MCSNFSLNTVNVRTGLQDQLLQYEKKGEKGYLLHIIITILYNVKKSSSMCNYYDVLVCI